MSNMLLISLSNALSEYRPEVSPLSEYWRCFRGGSRPALSFWERLVSLVMGRTFDWCRESSLRGFVRLLLCGGLRMASDFMDRKSSLVMLLRDVVSCSNP
uniref:(northern house mosquito) hypothetical protein n=1 Tax=Culex pipiens TaxID=7175 RepID=A0A8D8MNT2_CULPI